MNWAGAIALNRDALVRIVAGLVALLDDYAHAARLPLPVYHLIARALLPVESAVRRLIVIAARGLDVPLPPARLMPKGLAIAHTGARQTFPLYDTRVTFREDEAAPAAMPRILAVDAPSPREQFLAKFGDGREEAATERLNARVMILKRVLATLPAQAKRMARWIKRRAAMTGFVFRSPLRPGRPPGRRKHGKDQIDVVLRECHALARFALQENTS